MVLQAEVELKKFGVNTIVGSVNGIESRRVSYSVVPTPQLQQAMEQKKRQGEG